MTPIRDIALQRGNTLEGQIVDSRGMAQANCEMWITPEKGDPLRVRTNAAGCFAIGELPPGVYRIETASGGGKFRLWSAQEAPSDAPSNLLLVIRTRP